MMNVYIYICFWCKQTTFQCLYRSVEMESLKGGNKLIKMWVRVTVSVSEREKKI